MEKKIKENSNVEDKLENGTWKNAVQSITMPEQTKRILMGQYKMSDRKENRKVNFRLRYAKAIPAFCIAFLILTSSMTAYAVYMNTHLRIFFEQDITREELSQIESELGKTEGVFSWRYVDDESAWRDFSKEYLTPEMAESFVDNPLSESENFEVTISLNADVAQIKTYFENLDGVRKVLRFSEEE